MAGLDGAALRSLGIDNLGSYRRNLRAYWKCNESSGNITDYSGNGLTLTANGTPTYSSAIGSSGATGVLLAGDSTTYLSRTAAFFPKLAQWTISFWFDDNGSGVDTDAFISVVTDASNRLLLVHDNSNHLYVFDSAIRSVSGSVTIYDNAAHHLVFQQFAYGSYSVWFDGARKNIATGGTAKDPQAFTAFEVCRQGALGGGQPGIYGEIAVWDALLSENAINDLYNSGTAMDARGGGKAA